MKPTLLLPLLLISQMAFSEQTTQEKVNKFILESSFPAETCMNEAQFLGSLMDGRANGVTLAQVLSQVDMAKAVAPEQAEIINSTKMVAMKLYQQPYDPSNQYIPRYYKDCVKNFASRLPKQGR